MDGFYLAGLVEKRSCGDAIAGREQVTMGNGKLTGRVNVPDEFTNGAEVLKRSKRESELCWRDRTYSTGQKRWLIRRSYCTKMMRNGKVDKG